MRFISTRGRTEPLSFSEAVAVGLAPDGGLFLPEELPDLSRTAPGWAGLGYAELCFEFMRLFATDIPAETLRPLVTRAYERFSDPAIAPLRRLDERLYVLELFHGPTLAFKDFALQLLGNLYAHQCLVRRESINALGATSGDTGAAAIHGLLGRPGTAIFILYPDGRISPSGAPDGVHRGGQCVRHGCRRHLRRRPGGPQGCLRRPAVPPRPPPLGRQLDQPRARPRPVRLLPVRLAAASARGGEEAEFVVPTGNFGNILAGWMLRRMGVPIGGFRAATNQNDILYRLFTTGEYRAGQVRPSLAPSMDIQVASNFERFLYYRLGSDPARVRAAMDEFRRRVFASFRRSRPEKASRESFPPRAAPIRRFRASSGTFTGGTATSSIRTRPAGSSRRRPAGRASSLRPRARQSFPRPYAARSASSRPTRPWRGSRTAGS